MSTPPRPPSGTPAADPFEPHQPDIDLARDGARDRGDSRRNTGRLPATQPLPGDAGPNGSGGNPG